eukprot:39468_1
MAVTDPTDPVVSVINSFNKHFNYLQSADLKKRNKAAENIANVLNTMRHILYGDVDSDPSPHYTIDLARELCTNDMLRQFTEYILINKHTIPSERDLLLISGYIRNINFNYKQIYIPMELTNVFIAYFPLFTYSISYDGKRDTAHIMNYIFKRAKKYNCVEYIKSKTNNKGYNVIIHNLLKFDNCQQSLICLSIMKEIVKRSELGSLILLQMNDVIHKLFILAQRPNFDICYSAYTVLQLLVTRSDISSYLS